MESLQSAIFELCPKSAIEQAPPSSTEEGSLRQSLLLPPQDMSKASYAVPAIAISFQDDFMSSVRSGLTMFTDDEV
jgi:hypothetical protein